MSQPRNPAKVATKIVVIAMDVAVAAEMVTSAKKSAGNATRNVAIAMSATPKKPPLTSLILQLAIARNVVRGPNANRAVSARKLKPLKAN